MAVFDSFNINTSGLSLERLKLDTISTNIANVNTTRTKEGGAYHKKSVTFEESVKRQSADQKGTNPVGSNTKSYGVKVTGIKADNTDLKYSYDPSNPDADENGYVEMSNVDLADEMVDLMNTVRSYEANVSALESSKNLMKKALEISKN